MKAIFITSFFLIIITLSAFESKAQIDPHFSQYYVYPAWLNPALTGAFDGDRLSAIYRAVERVTSPSPPLVRRRISERTGTSSFGASVLNQSAGDGGYNYTTGYANFAYTGVKFGAQQTHQLSFGMQLGFIRKFDPSKLTFRRSVEPYYRLQSGGAPSADVRDRVTSAMSI